MASGQEVLHLRGGVYLEFKVQGLGLRICTSEG